MDTKKYQYRFNFGSVIGIQFNVTATSPLEAVELAIKVIQECARHEHAELPALQKAAQRLCITVSKPEVAFSPGYVRVDSIFEVYSEDGRRREYAEEARVQMMRRIVNEPGILTYDDRCIMSAGWLEYFSQRPDLYNLVVQIALLFTDLDISLPPDSVDPEESTKILFDLTLSETDETKWSDLILHVKVDLPRYIDVYDALDNHDRYVAWAQKRYKEILESFETAQGLVQKSEYKDLVDISLYW